MNTPEELRTIADTKVNAWREARATVAAAEADELATARAREALWYAERDATVALERAEIAELDHLAIAAGLGQIEEDLIERSSAWNALKAQMAEIETMVAGRLEAAKEALPSLVARRASADLPPPTVPPSITHLHQLPELIRAALARSTGAPPSTGGEAETSKGA
jgi:thioesterase domain-containing protein